MKRWMKYIIKLIELLLYIILFIMILKDFWFKSATINEVWYVIISLMIVGISWIISDLFNDNMKSDYREYLINELNNFETQESDAEIEVVDNVAEKEVISTLSTSFETKTTNKKDIIALMLKNNDEITEYFKISKKHAKSSFTFSVIASMIGVLMLGLAIYGTIIIEDTQLAIIGLVSGSITEVISGTVLWIHNKSALQLNHYYDALHQNEKFLSAVNMADKLNEEKREEMYIEIIRKQIEINN